MNTSNSKSMNTSNNKLWIIIDPLIQGIFDFLLPKKFTYVSCTRDISSFMICSRDLYNFIAQKSIRYDNFYFLNNVPTRTGYIHCCYDESLIKRLTITLDEHSNEILIRFKNLEHITINNFFVIGNVNFPKSLEIFSINH
jgi:hypothetical protein